MARMKPDDVAFMVLGIMRPHQDIRGSCAEAETALYAVRHLTHILREICQPRDIRVARVEVFKFLLPGSPVLLPFDRAPNGAFDDLSFYSFAKHLYVPLTIANHDPGERLEWVVEGRDRSKSYPEILKNIRTLRREIFVEGSWSWAW